MQVRHLKTQRPLIFILMLQLNLEITSTGHILLVFFVLYKHIYAFPAAHSVTWEGSRFKGSAFCPRTRQHANCGGGDLLHRLTAK